jgi:hypothetical protein
VVVGEMLGCRWEIAVVDCVVRVWCGSRGDALL